MRLEDENESSNIEDRRGGGGGRRVGGIGIGAVALALVVSQKPISLLSSLVRAESVAYSLICIFRATRSAQAHYLLSS